MFAVIKTGGKQYRVAADDVISVEKLAGTPGEQVSFSDVLMVGTGGDVTVGAPMVDGATVVGEIAEQGRGPKLIIFKKRRRKNSRRKNGHRQDLTVVKITDILTCGAKPKPVKKAEKAEPDASEPQAEVEETVTEAVVEAAAPETVTEAGEAAPTVEIAPDAPADPADEGKKGDDITPLFDTPEGDADDLKKISGVGPVLEKKLNALGITRFDQIAAFTADDIARVDEVLNFKGRIERDEWLGQAAALAKGDDA
ncbi:MAG: 50S ribosomal protein L21 [Pseudomonadota bacterium]